MNIIDPHTYLLFIGAMVALVLAPGPDMMYLLGRTVTQGRKAGLIAALGINCGGYVHLLAAVAGLSAILATSSVAFSIVKWIGAAYLVWLGIQAWRAKPANAAATEFQPAFLSAKAIFWQGFWSDVLNPKVAIFFLAFLPQFIDVGSRNETAQLLLLGVTGNVIAIAMNVVMVFCASAATRGLRRNEKITRWFNKALGAIFVSLGIRLAGEKI